ncbi:hypothetical protein [Streptomyces flavofungini]|uniref:Uncharacterized protein n=1 Tax=Streptomyces flavofungini TaxID=68200 RepID=A0ABS0XHA1_9ACTN|nr:hypothetical protein [Streptomyces flavofungini]MBJ3812592.1 hypothetical protein [Streptomyces flavofungini]GHC87774.1 hypothetical protein GCM10010349_74620 [Streptomyces flavofungini]
MTGVDCDSQLEITCDHALIRLRGHAFSHSQPLLDVARDVLAGRLHLEDNGDSTP